MRTRTLGVVAVLALALALALTGCGSSGGPSGVASVAKETSSASPSASLSRDEQNLKFAECLRANGMEIDDPAPGGGMNLRIDGRTQKETADKAMEACREHSPAANMSAEDKQKRQQDAIAFAQCMRKNGVEDFADPAPGEMGIKVQKGRDSDPDMDDALEVCQREMAARNPGMPTGGPKRDSGPAGPGGGGSGDQSENQMNLGGGDSA